MPAKRNPFGLYLSLCTIVLLVMSFSGCGDSGAPSAGTDNSIKSVAAGTPWLVSETTRLSELTIAEGASVIAPEGHSVTLTVDGVETGIKPGTYKGDIVLTVTKDIVATQTTFGQSSTFKLRAAVDVENGVYTAEKSVAAAAVGGTVTNTSATDVSISSTGEKFNGIIVSGNSTYAIDHPKIRFTGNGLNDFAGVGAGILVKDSSNVTVNRADIINDGVVRLAICANGNSTLTVNDSDIETGSPELPKTVVGMMSVPWMLGLTGTCRATMATESATVNYNYTCIRAKGWGALSTDAVQNVKLNATGCTIETVDSGYGAYADGNSVDTFSGCIFNVKDYALIMTQGSGVFTDGTVVNSGRFGVMNHSGRGGEKLTIERGCVFNTGEAAILVKSSAPDILVDSSTFNSKNGIILQAMINDDPDAGGPGGGGPGGEPGGGAPPSGGMPSGSGGGAPRAAMSEGTSPAGGMPPGSGMQGGTGGTGGGGSSDVHATFKNSTLHGDIITSMTQLGDMIVSFENVTITGAITTATWKSQLDIEGIDAKSFGAFSTEGYKYAHLIGQGTKTYCATEDEHGLSVSLDGKSTWVVDKTSYLTELTLLKGAVIKAPEGSSVTLMVNGKKAAIKAGTYKGKIELRVAQGA